MKQFLFAPILVVYAWIKLLGGFFSNLHKLDIFELVGLLILLTHGCTVYLRSYALCKMKNHPLTRVVMIYACLFPEIFLFAATWLI